MTEKKEKKEKVTPTTVEALKAVLDKAYGPNSLIEFDNEIAQVEVVSTGLPSLDLALGVGGLPRGRIIEVYGPEGAGKTAAVLRAIAWCQQNAGRLPRSTYSSAGAVVKPISGRCGFIDMEHAFDPLFARDVHGVKMGKGSGFHFAQPNSGTEALEMMEYMLNSGLFDIIALDSVAALTSKLEIDANLTDKGIAQIAQLMSDSLRKLIPAIDNSQTVVIFINQVREKPAVAFGSNETTPGGRALKFYASVRMRISKGESIMDGTLQVGHKWKAKIVKNKVAPPFSSTEIDLYYRPVEKKGKDAGFDIFSDLVECAKDMGVIVLSGSSYSFVDMSTGEVIFKCAGKVALKEHLIANPTHWDMVVDRMMGGVQIGKDSEPDEQE